MKGNNDDILKTGKSNLFCNENNKWDIVRYFSILRKSAFYVITFNNQTVLKTDTDKISRKEQLFIYHLTEFLFYRSRFAWRALVAIIAVQIFENFKLFNKRPILFFKDLDSIF